MFGGIGFMLHGNMACGVHKARLIVRVGSDAFEKALKEPGASVFDITGRPMKGWLMVEEKGFCEDRQLSDWLHLAKTFAESLPPKAGSEDSK